MQKRTSIQLATLGISLLLATSAFPQADGGSKPDLQQKLTALKQSLAQNQQRLHQYQWTENTVVTYKGDAKPPKQNLCQYGPDGKVQKTPIGGTEPQQSSGRQGRLKERAVEKKTDELQQYMGEVKSLLALYLPPNPQKMQQAFQAGKASISPAGGIVNLAFKDYAQPGDEMVIAFDPAAKSIRNINVNTYMGETKDAVTLAVKFATLPDGTNYTQQTVLNAAAKQIQVTTTNINYQKIGQ